MGKFDHINCMTQTSNISQDILGEAREKHVLAKPQSTQCTWTLLERKTNREKTQEHLATSLSTRSRSNKHIRKKAVSTKEQSKLSGGKRSGEAHLELLSKHRPVSKDDEYSSNSMVDAKTQPRQSQ